MQNLMVKWDDNHQNELDFHQIGLAKTQNPKKLAWENLWFLENLEKKNDICCTFIWYPRVHRASVRVEK